MTLFLDVKEDYSTDLSCELRNVMLQFLIIVFHAVRMSLTTNSNKGVAWTDSKLRMHRYPFAALSNAIVFIWCGLCSRTLQGALGMVGLFQNHYCIVAHS